MSDSIVSASPQQPKSLDTGTGEKRKVMTNLLGIADTIFTKMIPGKRQRRTVTTETSPQRPNTTNTEVIHSASQSSVPERPGTAPQAVSDTRPKPISIDHVLLRQIARAVCSEDEVASASQCYRMSRHRLCAGKRRLEYLQLRTIQMKEYVVRERRRLVQGGDEPKALDEEIAGYEGHLTEYENSIRNIDEQLQKLEHNLEVFTEQTETLQDLVKSELRTLLGEKTLPSYFKEEDYAISLPIAEEIVESRRKNCEEFEQGVLYKQRPSEAYNKYPRRATDDWRLHFDNMRTKREELDRMQNELAELVSQNVSGEELEECLGNVQAAKCELAEAVEDVRFAGVIVNSDGSRPQLDIDPEDEYHFGLRKRPGYEIEEQERIQDENQMTDEEIQQHFANTFQKTEEWLSSASLNEDPEAAGPKSPPSAGLATFRDRLTSVDFGESLSATLQKSFHDTQ